LFKTPLGIVTPDSITEARDYLVTIGNYVDQFERKGWPKHFDSKFINSIEQYLMRIPTNLGMKLEPQLFVPNLTAIQSQNQILDALDASYQKAIVIPQDDKKVSPSKEQKIFDVKLYVLEDKKEVDYVENMYRKSRNSVHVSYDYGIKKIFAVEMPTCKEQFEKYGKPLGNVMELWHGSTSENLINILRVGLKTRPPSTAHVTGKCFGTTGIYFSDQSTKSLNYAVGYWGGHKDSRVFMFLASVAMGKYYVPRGVDSNLPKPGYNSTFAKAHVSGVVNNECIVYKENQVNLKYLIEFQK
jgi:poly [ADP-ribose] polymerase